MVNNVKWEVSWHLCFSPKAGPLLAQNTIRKWLIHLKEQSIKPPFNHQRTQGSLTSSDTEKAMHIAREALFYAWHVSGGQAHCRDQKKESRSFIEAHKKILYIQRFFSQMPVWSLNISANNIKDSTQGSHFPAQTHKVEKEKKWENLRKKRNQNWTGTQMTALHIPC